ncbi:MAG: hypothetical protein DA408_10430 [Bacteroidetes bacterium]|nr:MAG: hypothetical protein C7N36_09145 [Bacteroidota bacterium]PTM12473.1 MAG: hypothetical protein DA408_10430 [Bacteroidota bacterium]
MKNEIHPLGLGQLWALLNQHWFKIGVVILLLYAFMSKDLSFNISVQAPVEPVEAPVEEYQETTPVRKETFTDNGLDAEPNTTRFDLLPQWTSNPDLSRLENLQRVEDRQVRAFVKRFAHVAEAEQEKFGLPASIILAHALLQSQAGQLEPAARGNNFFALPCTDDWQGQTQDGAHTSCLRRYDNAWLSFRDHSLYFTTGPHASLRKLSANQVAAWAKAMNNSKGNTIPDLDDQLLATIKAYQLAQYDN